MRSSARTASNWSRAPSGTGKCLTLIPVNRVNPSSLSSGSRLPSPDGSCAHCGSRKVIVMGSSEDRREQFRLRDRTAARTNAVIIDRSCECFNPGSSLDAGPNNKPDQRRPSDLAQALIEEQMGLRTSKRCESASEVLSETTPRKGLYAKEAAPLEGGGLNPLYQIGRTVLDLGRDAAAILNAPI